MNSFHRSWYYNIDPELHIIHIFPNCTGLKMARKYNYVRSFKLGTKEDGERLDELVNVEGYKICHACYNRELRSARLEKREAHPGFRHAPPGWKPPTVRPRGRTKKAVGDQN